MEVPRFVRKAIMVAIGPLKLDASLDAQDDTVKLLRNR